MRLTLCLSLAASLCHGVSASWPRLLNNFTAPPLEFRPKLRYWLPDAIADIDVVRDDLRQIAAVGAGGFEFLAYYEAGHDPSRWGKFGYGSDAFLPIFRAVMETADEQGIPMDFAIGANQGQGVPSEPGTEGLALHLTYSNVTVAPGQTFKGTLPLTIQAANKRASFMHHLEEFGEQTLIAVVAIEVRRDDSTAEGDYTEIDRIIDLTDKVAHGSRSLTWTAPKAAPGATWRIMAWYERFTNQRSIDGPSDAKTYLQNGSWIVDHFSAAGARIMDQFFDDHIVPEQSDRDLLASVGKYAWEDSMEMESTLWWTRGFDKDFKRALGYDIRTCLPLLLIKENGWAQVRIAYDEEFYSNNMTRGEVCNKDYRSVLQTKYEQYIQAHAEWARSKGLKFSNQPAYNLPLSMTESSPLLDAPEGESLGFFERIDAYKYLSGPAHFKKNPVISSELGAVRGMLSYSQTLSQVLWSFHRGLAGGVTMNVLHGYPYGGPYPNTTWPGVTIFNYLFPEMWGPRQPSWRAFPDLIEYMARNQYVLQAGTARVDLAMYVEDTPWTLSTGYLSNNLQELGYTHDYIGSSLLTSDLATTKDGVLVPDGPAYKALVVYNRTTVDSRMANKLGKLGHAGLPIFFVGDLEYGQDIVKQIIKRGSPNVYSLASKDELPKALRDAGIVPNAAILNKNQAAGWYSVWRSTPEAEYVWFYSDGENNDTPVKTLNISFSHMANRTPVLLDAWSGQATPLHHFKRGKTDMVIPMTLGGNETSIVAFVKDHGAKEPYVTDFTGSVKGFFSSAKKSKDAIFALVSDGAGTVTLSNGKECRFKTSVPKTTALNLWNITIESWERPNTTEVSPAKLRNITFSNQPLVPWLDLDGEGMDKVSGVGYYSTNFTLPPHYPKSGLSAYLHLGRFEGAVRLWLNGKQLPSALIYRGNDTVIDLAKHFQIGSLDNTDYVLEVEVSSTLLNRVRAEKDFIVSESISAGDPLGPGPRYEAASPIRYGLLGPVRIEWLGIAKLTEDWL